MGNFWRYFALAAAGIFLLLNATLYAVLIARTPSRGAQDQEAPAQNAAAGPGPRVLQAGFHFDEKADSLFVRVLFSDGMDFASPGDEAPLSFNPEIQGMFSWQDDRTLLFLIKKGMVQEELSVAVNSRLRDVKGRQLAGRLIFALRRPALALLGISQKGKGADGNPVLLLRFNDGVNPHDLLRYGTAMRGNRGLSFTPLGQAVTSEVKLLVMTALQGSISFTVGKGLRGATLAPLLSDKSVNVTVESALVLLKNEVREEPDGQFGVILDFNGKVASEALLSHLEIRPAVSAVVRPAGDNPMIVAPFTPGKAYTLGIRKGLGGEGGMLLEKEVTAQLLFPNLSPRLTLAEEGSYLPGGADLSFTLRTLNATKCTLQLEELYTNNIVPYVRDGGAGCMPGYSAKRHPDRDVEIEAPKNAWHETKVDLAELLGTRPRGTFLLRAALPEQRWRSSTVVVQVTDLGIVAKRARENMLVWVTSLASAAPVPGASVAVLSRTNQKLAEGVTDASGLIFLEGPFPTEEAEEPFVVTASSQGDTAFVALANTKIDPSQDLPSGKPYLDHGYEAYVWSERGVYRPGEQVNVYAIVRDRTMRSPGPFPVRFRITRPDGREWKILKGDLSEFATAHVSFEVPPYMPTGCYRVDALGGDGSVLGRRTFLNEEVRPDRMKVRLDVSPGDLRTGAQVRLAVSASHLFGDAAAGRPARGVLKLTPCSFASGDFRRYRFAPRHGPREKLDRTILLGTEELDGEGKGEFEVALPAHPLPPERYVAEFSVTVTEKGGRSVTANLTRPVDPYPFYLGIACQSPQLKAGLEAPFSIVALTPSRGPAGLSRATLRLCKVFWVYSYQERGGGRWEWVSVAREEELGSHSIELAEGRGTFRFTPDSAGTYVLHVDAAGTRHRTALEARVSGGGWSPRSFTHPADVALSADGESFAVGQEARISVASPFDGTLLLTIEGARVHRAEIRDVRRGTTELGLPVADEYWPNVYVSAEIIRPYWPREALTNLAKGTARGEEAEIEQAAARGEAEGTAAEDSAQPGRAGAGEGLAVEKRPFRAFGVIPLVVDRAARSVDIGLAAPAKVKPGEELRVSARTSDSDGHPLRSEIVLALVDEGLLSLTGETPPDPLGWFAAVRELTCTTSDPYSFLVPRHPLAPGGGEAAMEGLARRLNPVQYETPEPIAFFYEPRMTGDAGELDITLTAPDFAGALRVVALAVTEDRTGSCHGSVVVRPDIVIRTSYPRFMAPGDEAVVPAVFFNDLDRDARLRLELRTSGPVTATCDPELSLAARSEAVVPLRLAAGEDFGAASVTLRVTGEGFEQEEKTEFPVRPPWPPITLGGGGILRPGEDQNVSAADSREGDLPAFFPGTDEVSFVASPSPMAEFAPAARFLIRYPYGCGEQTTSALLALRAVKKLGLEEAGISVEALIARTIGRLAALQTASGGIGTWTGDRDPCPWISAFAGHVLLEVRDGNEILLEDVLEELLGYLEAAVGSNGIGPDSRAYAAYVCALADRRVAPQVLRLADLRLSSRAARFVACALKLLGEERAAEDLRARGVKDRSDSIGFVSTTVDTAIELLTDVRLGNAKGAEAAVERLRRAASHLGRWHTTHECAWALLALTEWAEAAGIGDDETPELAVRAGTRELFSGPLDKCREFKLTADELATLSCTVKGAQIYFSWTASGVPKRKEDVLGNLSTAPNGEAKGEGGFGITRRFYDFEGGLVTDRFILGSPYVVELTFKSLKYATDIVTLDILPGGLEIENSRLASNEALPDREFRGRRFRFIGPEHVEMRDDRLIIFHDVPAEDRKIPTVYRYAVRAVSEGKFALPSALAEGMYDPTVRSATAGGSVAVVR